MRCAQLTGPVLHAPFASVSAPIRSASLIGDEMDRPPGAWEIGVEAEGSRFVTAGRKTDLPITPFSQQV